MVVLYENLAKNAQKIEDVENKLLNDPNSFRLNSWMSRLIKQREKLLIFNQKYWGKLARKEWLIDGNRNSKFFPLRANARRRKKLILKLKDKCGVWLDDQKMIADKFIYDYDQRFASACCRSHILLDLGLPKLIN